MLSDLYLNMPRIIQNAILSLYGHNLKRNRFGSDFISRLDYLESSQNFSLEKVEEYQNFRLSKLIGHAAIHVPYYHNLFSKLKLSPADIRCKQDLKKLPILRKSDILKNPKAFISSNSDSGKIKLHTSGTTGSPLSIITTKQALGFDYANVWRQRRWYGVNMGDKLATFNGRVILKPTQRTKKPFRRNFSFNQTLFSLFHLDDYHVGYMVEELINGGYAYINGYPSSLEYLAKKIVKLNLKVDGIKAIFTSSETLSDECRRILKNAFNATISDRYSSTEAVCSYAQAPDGLYYHNSEDSIVEYGAVKNSPYSKLICTGLNNYSMPLIRYEMDDLLEVGTQNENPLFDRESAVKIIGREEDTILTPSGKNIGRLDSIFKGLENIERSQIIQDGVDHITVKIEINSNYSSKDRDLLYKSILSRLPEFEVAIEQVDSIALQPNGKFKSVIRKKSKHEPS